MEILILSLRVISRASPYRAHRGGQEPNCRATYWPCKHGKWTRDPTFYSDVLLLSQDGLKMKGWRRRARAPAGLTPVEKGSLWRGGASQTPHVPRACLLLVVRVLLIDFLQHVDFKSSCFLVLFYILNDLQGNSSPAPVGWQKRLLLGSREHLKSNGAVWALRNPTFG